MNIKSLLLGSAAALVAVSGARAADAVEVVAEPEPMEYVRVCDTYGAGFYYIPGTETCLRVGGYVRYDIGAGYYGVDVDADGESDTYRKRARASLIFDARSETELGTLRGFIQIHGNWNNNGATAPTGVVDPATGLVVVTDGADNEDFNVAHAYIELGGFLVGKTDSLFNRIVGGGYIIHDDELQYGAWDTNQIGYTFDAGNGFTVGVSLEEGTGQYELEDYMPHVVAGAAYTAGWGAVQLAGAYDSVEEEFAVKGRIEVNASESVKLFVMGAWSDADDATGVNDRGVPFNPRGNFYATWGGDWGIWGGAEVKLSEKATLGLQAAYNDYDDLQVAAQVAYEVVPQFTITPEISYVTNLDDNPDGQFPGDSDDGDEWGAFLRFQRNF